MPKKTAPFKTEADLCAAFIAAIGEDWTSYAETGGWDILLVRKDDGFQIGIEAKLKLNAFVLAQALDQYRHAVMSPGPDCRAILVPEGEMGVGLTYICAYIGITIIRMSPADDRRFHRYPARFKPKLPVHKDRYTEDDWYELAPAARCKLPEYVPDVRAGAPAPLQLTDWKIGALKLECLLEHRGFVTRQDFRHFGIDHRLWIARGRDWLKVVDGRFVKGPLFPAFKAKHPVVFAQIKADAAKWMPKAAEPTGTLL